MSPRPQDPRSPQPGEPRPEETPRDDRLGAALSDLPVPDHGPTFWADLDHRLQGDPTVPQRTESATEAGPEPTTTPQATETVSLDEQRARRAARRGGRMSRSLVAAAAAVALVVAVAGAVTVIRQDDSGTDIRAADPPAGTAQHDKDKPATPAEFSATYDGIEGFDGPDGCCSTWNLTVASDGSFNWWSVDGQASMAYDAANGTHVQKVNSGAGAAPNQHPTYIVTSGVPAGGPDQRVARPDPLDPIADFVVALAGVGDSRITTATVAGRPAWHYDGPIVQDRLGGDGAPNHIVADVDQAAGVLLHLTRRIDELVVTRFTASDITTSDQINRRRYATNLPEDAKRTNVALGFVPRTLDEANRVSYGPILVPSRVPSGFTLESVSLDPDVPSPTGPEGMNPPAKEVVAMTWRNGANRFTVTLRPSGGEQWDDPFGGEGMVPDAQPVHFEPAGRPPLDGEVIVDAPLVPHLWGTTANVVVTVSGDLSRAELEMVAGSLRPHES